MKDWQVLAKLAVLGILELGLAVAAFWLVERTIEGAMKAVKGALKLEINTDAGKLNLAGLIGFLFLTVFTNLHETLAGLVVKDKATPLEAKILPPATVFGLLFIGSVICVAIFEKHRRE